MKNQKISKIWTILIIIPLLITGCEDPDLYKFLYDTAVTIGQKALESGVAITMKTIIDNMLGQQAEGHVIIDPKHPLHGKYSTTLKIVRKRNGRIIDELNLNRPEMVRDTSNPKNPKSYDWRLSPNNVSQVQRTIDKK